MTLTTKTKKANKHTNYKQTNRKQTKKKKKTHTFNGNGNEAVD